MIDKNQIIDEARMALDALFNRRVRDWTVEVKTALCNACRNCNTEFYLYATGVQTAHGGEWLYDVSCLLYDENNYLKDIGLVAESEGVSKARVYEDFEKLLLVRAEVRVMVFDGRLWTQDDRFTKFSQYIMKCERTEPGDIYLLAAWLAEGFQYCRIDAFQTQRILE